MQQDYYWLSFDEILHQHCTPFSVVVLQNTRLLKQYDNNNTIFLGKHIHPELGPRANIRQ